MLAEQAGFDGISASDHLQPWWEPGESGHAWVWLAAAAQATERIPFGTGVTPPGARFHPALIAQAWMTYERMFPGRPYLGIGSGEALNEVPVGDDWPSPADQIARMDEALDHHRPAVEGRDDHPGGPLLPAARLQAAHAGRPPPADLGVRVRAAGGRGRRPLGRRVVDDQPDPESTPEVIETYRDARRRAGHEGDGEVVFQALVSWADRDEQALEQARKWKGAQPEDHYTDDWQQPREMYEHGERKLDDEEFAQNIIAGVRPG